MHDSTVDRTTDGAGAVADLTLARLRELDAGGGRFEGRFTGERIPTLAEVLDRTRTACLLVIEIKQREIERAVADVVRRLNAAGSSMIWSFHEEVVGAARAILPEVPAAQLWGGQRGDAPSLIAGAVLRNAQGISVHHASVDADLVRAARLRGLTVFTWTPDEPADQARVATAGVDGICTNLPDLLRATLRQARDQGAGGTP